ncbi:MAG: hypothetical protein AAF532_07825 [Planctomycetota bacterium]
MRPTVLYCARRTWPAASTTFLIFVAGGCGEASKDDVVPVSGLLTLEGQPVAGIPISFVPRVANDTDKFETPPKSSAVTGEDGRFELKTAERSRRSGAVPGRHRVYFGTRPDPSDPVNGIDVLPADRGDTFFEVPAEGTAAADFAF